MVVGFASALAALHLDPRFRGNDRTGVRLRRTGSLRVSLNSPFIPSPKIEDPPQEEWGIQGVEKATCPIIALFDTMRVSGS
jgi:hypothetical protein